jgi:hypothetical protein
MFRSNIKWSALPLLCTHPMELEVESTGVADGVTLIVTAPERRRRRGAVGTRHPLPSDRAL